eukprot:SAG31_NODE_8071_length_1528_cov_2.191043_2_plen_106_part_00
MNLHGFSPRGVVGFTDRSTWTCSCALALDVGVPGLGPICRDTRLLTSVQSPAGTTWPLPPPAGDGGKAFAYGDLTLVVEGVTEVGGVVDGVGLGGKLLGGWWTFN